MSVSGRKIAVLTSGGDCSGMNSSVSAIVKTGIHSGCEVYVVREGYEGLVRGNGPLSINWRPQLRQQHNVVLSHGYGDSLREGAFAENEEVLRDQYIIKVGWDDVRNWSSQGGTVIGTARCKAFREREGRKKAAKNLISLGINSLIVCGGDGSLTGADVLRQEWPSLVQELVKEGIVSEEMEKMFAHLHLSGLVCSIDNDMSCTDLTIGSATALQRICEALDSISSTALSHSRAFVVEVMGRHCGWLALMAGIAAGADYVFVPEQPPQDEWRSHMRERLEETRKLGKRKTIVIVAEGATNASLEHISSAEVAKVLSEDMRLDTRVTTLGHIQRGGRPHANDRIIAIAQGVEAVKAALDDTPDKQPYIICVREGRLQHVPLREAVQENNKLAKAIAEKRFDDALKMRGQQFIDGLRVFSCNSAPPPTLTREGLRIAIMHVGAPAGGMDAATRMMVRFCISHGHTPLLILNGFRGLMDGTIETGKWLRVDTWASSGGSEIGTNRTLPDTKDVAEQLQRHKIDALLVVGGFEAFRSVCMLADARDKYEALRLPVIALPATLSNNLPFNEYTIGMYTSLDEVVRSCDLIKQSATASRNRVFVIEVQGGQCGFLAVFGALATHGSIVYTPEEGISLRQLLEDTEFLHRRFHMDPPAANEGRVIICSERASTVYKAQLITEIFGLESEGLFDSRYERLSHTLQGGIPAPMDRVEASRLALMCCEFLEKHATNPSDEPPAVMITKQEGKIAFTPIVEVAQDADYSLRRGKNVWWSEYVDIVRMLSGRKLL